MAGKRYWDVTGNTGGAFTNQATNAYNPWNRSQATPAATTDPFLNQITGITVTGDQVIIDGSASGLANRTVNFNQTTVFFNKTINIINAARLRIPYNPLNTSPNGNLDFALPKGVNVFFVNCVIEINGSITNTVSSPNSRGPGYNFNDFNVNSDLQQPHRFWSGDPGDRNFNGTYPGAQRRPPDTGLVNNSNSFHMFGCTVDNNLTFNGIMACAFGHVRDTIFIARDNATSLEMYRQPTGTRRGTSAERDAFYGPDSDSILNRRTVNYASWFNTDVNQTQVYDGTNWVEAVNQPDAWRVTEWENVTMDNSRGVGGYIMVIHKDNITTRSPTFIGTIPQLASSSFNEPSGRNPGLDTPTAVIEGYTNENPVNNGGRKYYGIQNGNLVGYTVANRDAQGRHTFVFPSIQPYGWISRNANTRIPNDEATRRTAVQYNTPASNGRDDARLFDIIETTVWDPTFIQNATTNEAAAGIRVAWQTNYGFGTTDTATATAVHPFRQLTGESITGSGLTDANGRIVSTTSRNPHDGRIGVNGSLEFTTLHLTGRRNSSNTGFIDAQGGSTSQSQSRLWESSATMRAFWQVLTPADDPSRNITYADGVRTISFSVPLEITRTERSDYIAGAITEGNTFHPEDQLLPRAILNIPSANRDETNADSTLITLFPSDSSVNGSEIYAAAKYYHWIGMSSDFPAAISGAVTFNSDLNISNTATAAHSSGTNLLSLRGNGINLESNNSSVTSLDLGNNRLTLNGGSISGNINSMNIQLVSHVTEAPSREGSRSTFDIAGDVTGTITYPVPANEVWYVRINTTGRSGDSLTINNSGAGTIEVSTQTVPPVPATGSTNSRAQLNSAGITVTASNNGGVRYETTLAIATQATRLDLQVNSLATSAINTGQYALWKGAMRTDSVIASGTFGPRTGRISLTSDMDGENVDGIIYTHQEDIADTYVLGVSGLNFQPSFYAFTVMANTALTNTEDIVIRPVLVPLTEQIIPRPDIGLRNVTVPDVPNNVIANGGIRFDVTNCEHLQLSADRSFADAPQTAFLMARARNSQGFLRGLRGMVPETFDITATPTSTTVALDRRDVMQISGNNVTMAEFLYQFRDPNPATTGIQTLTGIYNGAGDFSLRPRLVDNIQLNTVSNNDTGAPEVQTFPRSDAPSALENAEATGTRVDSSLGVTRNADGDLDGPSVIGAVIIHNYSS